MIAREGIRPTSRRGGGWLALGFVVLTTLGAGVRLVSGPSPDPAEGDHRVEGLVVDGNGAAVRGAEILVAYGTSMTVHARTGTDGAFAFSVRHEDPHFAVRARVVARAHDRGIAWERVDAGAGRGLRLELPAAGSIEGRIVSLEGEPVAGVRVQACELRESRGGTLEGWLRALGGDRLLE